MGCYYDSSKNLLTFSTFNIEQSKDQFNINIMSDIQESYKWFLSKGVYLAMDHLHELCTNLGDRNLANATIHTRIGSLISRTYMKTQVQEEYSYYPVFIINYQKKKR